MKDKKELRKEIRLRKKQYTESELKKLSLPIMRKLLELSCIKNARTIMLYCSLPDEVYSLETIRQLKEEGKRIVLPVVTSDTEMELHTYNGDADLHIGRFNILEPCGEKFIDYADIDLIIVPGMAFDDSNNRLGRGKGYYDRFLEKLKDKYKIGICFPFQRVHHLPTSEHDIRMDMVIS